MASMTCHCYLLALLVLPLLSSAADSVHVAEGKAADLKCEVKDKATKTFQYWDVVFDKVKTTERLDNDHTGGTIQVMDNGWSLYIPSVNEGHYGPYKCVYHDADGKVMEYTVMLLQARKSTFEKFRLSIIVSLVACVVALVVLGAICIVYNYRWERRHGQDGKSLVREEHATSAAARPQRIHSYSNEIFVDDKGQVMADTVVSQSHL